MSTWGTEIEWLSLIACYKWSYWFWICRNLRIWHVRPGKCIWLMTISVFMFQWFSPAWDWRIPRVTCPLSHSEGGPSRGQSDGSVCPVQSHGDGVRVPVILARWEGVCRGLSQVMRTTFPTYSPFRWNSLNPIIWLNYNLVNDCQWRKLIKNNVTYKSNSCIASGMVLFSMEWEKTIWRWHSTERWDDISCFMFWSLTPLGKEWVLSYRQRRVCVFVC